MSIHRAHSTRITNQQRPFSTNNPFRNASLDSNINSVSSINQQNFTNWVRQNQSQLSFSSDDEDSLMPPPRSIRPPNERSSSAGSTNSYNQQRMTVPRRTSNNPFQEALSADSTGNSQVSNTPPTYPSNTTSTTDYYNTDEKSRDRARAAAAATSVDLPPPSYEEVSGAKSNNSEYPREKSTSQSAIDEHRTRMAREWPGESRSGPQREGSTRSHRPSEHRSHRSERPSNHESSSRAHRHGSASERGSEHRSHRHESSSTRDPRDASAKDSSRHGSREHRSKSSREHRSKSKSKKSLEPPPKNVDTIDKLDVTGLFGGAFHHDGPFDACTPHRNKNTKSAPVLAFPADGPNSSIRGSGPVNVKDATLKYIQGRDDADDELYSTSVSRRANDSQSTLAAIKTTGDITHLDTNKTSTPVHGITSLGLGSTTFLDGAPAPAAAPAGSFERSNTLGRKKSLKQRLTGDNATPVNRPRAVSGDDEDQQFVRFSDDFKEKDSGTNSLLKRVKSLKVGRSKN